MQISTYFLAAALLATGAAPVFAQDSQEDEDRARAREELNRKMAELENQLQSTEEPKPIEQEPSKATDTTTSGSSSTEMPSAAAPAVSAPSIEAEPTTAPSTPTEPSEPKAAEISTPEPAQPMESEPVHMPAMETPPTHEAVSEPVTSPEPVAPAPVEATAPVELPQAKPIVVVPPVKTAPTRAELEQARDEMRRKIADLDAQDRAASASRMTAPSQPSSPPTAPKAPPAPVRVSEPAATAAPMRTTSDSFGGQGTSSPTMPDSSAPTMSSSTPRTTASSAAASDEALEKARMEMRQKIADLNAQDRMSPHSMPGGGLSQPRTSAPRTSSPYSAPSASSAPAPRDTSETMGPKADAEKQAMKESNYSGSLVPTPTSSVSAAKQIRLNELLSKYKSDQITPEEYHTQRARILAEP